MTEDEYRARLIKEARRRARLIREGKLRADPRLPVNVLPEEK